MSALGRFRRFIAAVPLIIFLAPRVHAQSPAAGTWERLGPEGGEVVSISSGADGTLYLGTPDGHIFASTDGARHWELRGRATPRFDGRLDAVVQRLIVDSRAPQRLFAAVWFQDPVAGGGIYRSDDAGRTWSLAGLRGEAVRALEQAPAQPEIFVAGTRTGVFRSADRGTTWQRISPAGDAELRNLDSLAFDPRDPLVIYAGTYHLPWKTLNGGKTWAPVAAGMIDDSDIMSLRVDITNPSRIYSSACSGIYRSDNGGAQWTKLEGVPYAARRTQAIVQDPADPRTVYAGTTEGLWVTRDAGETWTRTTPRDWAVNGIALVPAEATHPARVVLATESHGVQVSDDAGVHFAASNAGFSHRIVAAFAVNSSQPGRWLARINQPGPTLLETRDAGQTWLPLSDDPAFTAGTQFFGTSAGWFAAPPEGGLFLFDEVAQAWRSFHFLPPSPRESSRPGAGKTPVPTRKARSAPREVQPLVREVSVKGARLLIAAEQGLWSGDVSPNVAGRLLRPVSSESALPPILNLDFNSGAAPGNALGNAIGNALGNEWWLATRGSLFYSHDAGKSWQIAALPPDAGALRWVRSVTISNQPGLLLGTVSGVFSRLSSSSSSSPIWHRLGAGLPSTEMLPPSLLGSSVWTLAAKAGGLYFSRDEGASWTRLDGIREASYFLGPAWGDAGSLVTGSRSEGILRWRSQD